MPTLSILGMLWLFRFQDPGTEKLEELTRSLRSDHVDERDRASLKFKELGKAAVPWLEELKKDKDAEVAVRARILVDAILYGFPKLEASRTLELPLGAPPQIFPSSTGRFLALLDPTSVRIYERSTLNLLKGFRIRASAIRFDGADKELVAVGDELIRMDTSEWRETFRAPLPNAECARPGQALIITDTLAYYRTAGGGLSRADFQGNTLTVRPQETVGTLNDETIDRMFASGWDESLLIDLGSSKRAAVWFRGKVYLLAPSDQVIGGTFMLSRVVLVGKRRLISYSDRFKILNSYPPLNQEPDGATWETTSTAAFDSQKGIVFTVCQGHLRGRSILNPADETTYDSVPEDLSHLAVDSHARVLYAVAKGSLLSWKLRD